MFYDSFSVQKGNHLCKYWQQSPAFNPLLTCLASLLISPIKNKARNLFKAVWGNNCFPLDISYGSTESHAPNTICHMEIVELVARL